MRQTRQSECSARTMSTSIISQPLTQPSHIADKVVLYGAFFEALEYMKKLLKSESSTTIIIRGNVGSGKKTLIKVLETHCQKTATFIYINPFHYKDDYTAIRMIASKLGFHSEKSLQKIMDDIQQRAGMTTKRIVIVLHNFEEFCRRKQSLLYSLTTLAQHGVDISLIGLTVRLDCTENLEKRVRSRMNALFYHLDPPYRNQNDYLEFASFLLNQEIEGKLKERLESIYCFESRSIRTLKKFLIACCSWDDHGVMTVNQPFGSMLEPESDLKRLEIQLDGLLRDQMELILVAVCYCHESGLTYFKLDSLNNFTVRHNFRTNTKNRTGLRNASIMTKIGLFKNPKPKQKLTENSTLTIGITPFQLRRVLEMNPKFQSIKTAPLWKKLPH